MKRTEVRIRMKMQNETYINGQILFLDLRLSKFARYIRIYGTDLLSVISDTHRGTLFAPSNDAFDVMTQEEIEELLADPVQGNHNQFILPSTLVYAGLHESRGQMQDSSNFLERNLLERNVSYPSKSKCYLSRQEIVGPPLHRPTSRLG